MKKSNPQKKATKPGVALLTPRRQARMCVLQLLFQLDLHGLIQVEGSTQAEGSIKDAKQAAVQETTQAATQESTRFWQENQAAKPAKAYGSALASYALQHMGQIDAVLNTALVGWKLARLATVVRAALRMGVGEMLQGKVATTIVIHEVVNLTDAFMDEPSASFVNGVLDTCKRTLTQPPTA